MKAQWVSVDERYPEITKTNPYPTCIVWCQCIANGPASKIGGMKFGELRLLGGDRSRPYWVSPFKGDNLTPLENSAYKVTHWIEWSEGGNEHGMMPQSPGS